MGFSLKGVGLVHANGHRALQGIDLSIADGERVALVGASGAGKTTLLRLLAGELSAQQGSLRIQGVALAEQAQSAIDAISHNADEINQLVHDISLALKEQTTASQDVARNVEQVAQLSEENSRAVMQTADATVYLKTLASQLDKAVHSFRL